MSHGRNMAQEMRQRFSEPAEPVYLTEEEYQLFKFIDTPDNRFEDTPETEALIAKISGKDMRNIQVRPDGRVMKKVNDMRAYIALPPDAPEARYPRSTDVSSHPHAVLMSGGSKLYASDYFLHPLNPHDLSFVPVERRVDKTPLSPINGQGHAILQSIRTDESIFAGTQLAFQGAIPEAYRQGFVRLSE
jgi:hypothetical protein